MLNAALKVLRAMMGVMREFFAGVEKLWMVQMT
jgi:hypothetical protein